jgi:hypothetical protein
MELRHRGSRFPRASSAGAASCCAYTTARRGLNRRFDEALESRGLCGVSEQSRTAAASDEALPTKREALSWANVSLLRPGSRESELPTRLQVRAEPLYEVRPGGKGSKDKLLGLRNPPNKSPTIELQEMRVRSYPLHSDTAFGRLGNKP